MSRTAFDIRAVHVDSYRRTKGALGAIRTPQQDSDRELPPYSAARPNNGQVLGLLWFIVVILTCRSVARLQAEKAFLRQQLRAG
jgi:hypothetical protein